MQQPHSVFQDFHLMHFSTWPLQPRDMYCGIDPGDQWSKTKLNFTQLLARYDTHFASEHSALGVACVLRLQKNAASYYRSKMYWTIIRLELPRMEKQD